MTVSISNHPVRGHQISGKAIPVAIAATAALSLAALAWFGGSGTGTVVAEPSDPVLFTEVVADDAVLHSTLGPRWDFNNQPDSVLSQGRVRCRTSGNKRRFAGTLTPHPDSRGVQCRTSGNKRSLAGMLTPPPDSRGVPKTVEPLPDFPPGRGSTCRPTQSGSGRGSGARQNHPARSWSLSSTTSRRVGGWRTSI